MRNNVHVCSRDGAGKTEKGPNMCRASARQCWQLAVAEKVLIGCDAQKLELEWDSTPLSPKLSCPWKAGIQLCTAEVPDACGLQPSWASIVGKVKGSSCQTSPNSYPSNAQRSCQAFADALRYTFFIVPAWGW